MPPGRRALQRARQLCEPGHRGHDGGPPRLLRPDVHLARPAHRERGQHASSRSHRQEPRADRRAGPGRLRVGEAARRAHRLRHRPVGAGGPEIAAPRVRDASGTGLSRAHHPIGQVDESRVRKHFAEALRHAKLDSFTLYDLRHTFASQLLARGAPITYVAAQLGHANPAITLQFYAHWVPTEHQRFVDLVPGPKTKRSRTSRAASPAKGSGARAGTRGHQLGTKSSSGASDDVEAPEKIGGPSRTRTLDPLIKSQLLYQLS